MKDTKFPVKQPNSAPQNPYLPSGPVEPLMFEEFEGLNTATTRPGVDDKQMAWVDGFIPLGPLGYLRTLYGVGPALFAVAQPIPPESVFDIVAGGEDGTFTVGRILVSHDSGLTWVSVSPAVSTDVFMAAFRASATKYIFGGKNAYANPTDVAAEYSTNTGDVWNSGSASVGFGTTISQIAYDGSTTYAGVGENFAVTSTDGQTWTTNLISGAGTPFVIYGVAFGAGVWVIAGIGSNVFSNNPVVVTTTDFITYTPQTVPATHNDLIITVKVCFGGGLFTMVGGNLNNTDKGFIYTSPDGITWTSRTLPTVPFQDGALFGVATNGSTIVAAGCSGNGAHTPFPVQPMLFTSVDGGGTWVWQALFLPLGSNVTDVTWNGTHFVVSGSDGEYFTNPSILVSTDGMSWTVRLPQAPVIGSELIANSTFMSNDTGWTFDNTVTTWAPGDFFTNYAGSGDAFISIDVVTATGQWYAIEVDQSIINDFTEIYFNNNTYFADSDGQSGNLLFYMQADFTGTDQIFIDLSSYNTGAQRHVTKVSVKAATFSAISTNTYLECVA